MDIIAAISLAFFFTAIITMLAMLYSLLVVGAVLMDDVGPVHKAFGIMCFGGVWALLGGSIYTDLTKQHEIGIVMTGVKNCKFSPDLATVKHFKINTVNDIVTWSNYVGDKRVDLTLKYKITYDDFSFISISNESTQIVVAKPEAPDRFMGRVVGDGEI